MIVEGALNLVGRYCLEKNLPYEEYSVPGTYVFHRNELADESKSARYGRGHAFLARLSDVCVFGDGFILTSDQQIFVHGLNHRNYHLDIDDYLMSSNAGVLRLDIPEITTEVSGPAVLIWGRNNFGHWMFEYLPRIAIAAREQQTRDIAYVVTDDIPDRFVDFLVGAGIRQEQIVRLPAGKSVYFQDLWVPSVANYRGHYSDKLPYIWTDGMYYLRSKILGDDAHHGFPTKGRGKRIYISRKSAEMRKPTNDDQVMECISQFGVEENDMNGMSFDDQIDSVRNAELIVIAAGASSPITMYAPKGCVVIEFAPDTLVGTFGTMAWAHMMGQKYQRMACKSVDETANSNYLVDVDLLRDYLIRAEQYLAPKGGYFRELGTEIWG